VSGLAASVGVQGACEALAVPRASYYRSLSPRPAAKPRPRPARSLSADQRQQVLAELRSDRFVDAAPRQVYAKLLDEDRYLCSVRTMYRLLDEQGEVRERRDQLRRPAYQKPELLATGPNQVWSWDITKLRGPVKWTYYYLYVILDIFSRYVVGWMLAHAEDKSLAKRLIADTIAKQNVSEGQLTLHADRGSAMTSKPVALLLAELGITRTHSRPHTSDDNPFSEAQFKTLKYHRDFPDRFGSYQHCEDFLRPFFHWYNTEHYHVGLGLLTPEMVHYGTADQVLQRRQQALLRAYHDHPERFRGRPPVPLQPPRQVWINPPKTEHNRTGEADHPAPPAIYCGGPH